MEEILASIRRIISEDGEDSAKDEAAPEAEAAAEPAPEPEPEQEPEQEYEVSCDNKVANDTMQFDVDSNVSDEDITLIRCAFGNGQDFLDRMLGGGISDSVLANITVRVVATGEGDPHPDGGGSSATVIPWAGPEGNDIRIFFDVAHSNWVNSWSGWPIDQQRERTVIHELSHAWHASLGCTTKDHRLGFWISEGAAEQVPFANLIDNGELAKKDAMDFMERFAKGGEGQQWNTPLRELEANGNGVWPGHIGYLGLEFAMNMDSAPHGLESVRVLCEEFAEGVTVQEAFQTTFGTDMDSFYAQFEAWKDQQS